MSDNTCCKHMSESDMVTTIEILKHNVHELQKQLQEAYIRIADLSDENQSLSSIAQRDQLCVDE